LAAQNNSSTTPVPQFVDVAPQAGLTVSHSGLQGAALQSLNPWAAEWASLTCDNDGRLDIIVTNGSSIDRYPAPAAELMVTPLSSGAPTANSPTSPSRPDSR